MTNYKLLILLLLAFAPYVSSQNSIYYNVKNFGAIPDGKTIASEAINKTIDAAASAGGGTVFIPSGNYLCLSIHMKSNINLYLDQNAIIIAATPSDSLGWYDMAEPNIWGDSLRYQDFGHSHWHNSLIWGENLSNISITGFGIIDGKGLRRGGGDSKKMSGLEQYSKAGLDMKGQGNKAIALKNCYNVSMRDFTIINGGHFAILATGVDNYSIDNLKIDTNRDGIDIDCCNNVRVSNCSINAPWDDGLCLKASYALGHIKHCQNITITNCFLSGFDRGTMFNNTWLKGMDQTAVPDEGGTFGRIKFGTESNGDYKNITISNCVFENSRGIALESMDGSNIEDVSINNITMRDANSSPIFMRIGSRMRGPKEASIGHIRRISISNLVAYNANANYCTLLSGIPGYYIENVKLDNIRIWYAGGGTKEQAEAIMPENEKSYPDPQMFGILPAYGFYIRHVKDIELSNIEIHFLKDEFRPAFVLEDVLGINMLNVKVQQFNTLPLFVLKNVTKFSTWHVTGQADKTIDKIEYKKF
jgi:polygalacturonase